MIINLTDNPFTKKEKDRIEEMVDFTFERIRIGKSWMLCRRVNLHNDDEELIGQFCMMERTEQEIRKIMRHLIKKYQTKRKEVFLRSGDVPLDNVPILEIK